MHRFTAVAMVLAISAIPALAQPVVHPPCAVTIAHAPDDVRAVVEHWVAAEPRCGTPLEVRIVPTEGGLYLFARDDRGRVRERLVPDAQSAGVLVASWAADDAIAEPPAPVESAAPVESVAPVAPVEPPVMAPGVMFEAPGPERVRYVIVLAHDAHEERSITIGAGLGDNAFGLRASADLWTLGSWTIGAAGSLAAQSLDYARSGFFDLRATAYVAHTNHLGNWRVRGAIGVGVDFTRYYLGDPSTTSIAAMPVEPLGTSTSPVAQFTVTLARALDQHWGVEVGPVLTVYPTVSDYMGTLPRQADLMVFAGLQHQL